MPRLQTSSIDSCFSGLTLKLGNEVKSSNSEIKRLSFIRSEVEQKARNLLLAATDYQEAIATQKNGGIFTQVLIDALKGDADGNNDNIIDFNELARYIKENVAYLASQQGEKQYSVDSRLRAYGNGGIIFLRQNF